MVKATQMGCVYVTNLRLMNSSFRPTLVKMNNYFEARLMVLSQKVDFKEGRLGI